MKSLFAVVLVALLSCTTTSQATRTNITVAVRDATELYGFAGIPVQLSCEGCDASMSRISDDHGVVQFSVASVGSCTVTSTWKTEHFAYSFVPQKRTINIMLVSRFAFITHGVEFERPMKARRIYPEEARP